MKIALIAAVLACAFLLGEATVSIKEGLLLLLLYMYILCLDIPIATASYISLQYNYCTDVHISIIIQGRQFHYYPSCGSCYYHDYKGDTGPVGYEVSSKG